MQTCVEYPDRVRFIRKLHRRDATLTRVQQVAIKYAEERAYNDCGESVCQLKDRMRRLARDESSPNPVDEILNWLAHEAPIIIHVKLGPRKDKTDMVDAYMNDKDKLYRNMFELGSEAGRGPTDKGARASWEKRLFGPDFGREVTAAERPKYGCINMTADPLGVPCATQYGSSYLVLKNSLRWRCTFTSRDSDNTNSRIATPRQFAKFLADGCMGTSDDELLNIWRHSGETIDDYREVQIHGPVRFDHD